MKTDSQFRKRTREFALRVIKLMDALPNTKAGDVIGRGLARSGMSAGATYVVAGHSRSTRELVANLSVAAEQLDEALYWLELLIESELLATQQVIELHAEAAGLLASVLASIQAARKR
jgi:four helix bundle protein